MQRLRNIKTRFFWRLYLTYATLFLVLIAILSWRIYGAFMHDIAPHLAIQSAIMNDIARQIWSNALVVIVAVLLLGLWPVYRITQPLREMVLVSHAMRHGRYDKKVKTIPNDELGLLGETLNHLSSTFTNQIERISLDRAQLKTILANMVEGIIAIDSHNRILFCNQAAYALLQSELTDCRGLQLDQVAGFSRLVNIVSEARQAARRVEEEIRIRDELNNKFVQCYAAPFREADANGVIVVIHDISEVRKLEAVRRDFIANISHELKTPLTAIKGYTETLLSGALEDQQNARRFVEKIESNTVRLVSLVKDILSLAQTEAGSEDLQLQPTSWNQIVDEVIHRHEDDAAAKNIALVLENNAPHMQVNGDYEAMVQILENLLSNAIRYTPASGGTVTVRIFQENEWGWLEVSDTGIGIKPKHIERIFQRFYRVDKSRTREFWGTGLGLSIVQHLVTRMHGKIFVNSEIEQGTTFRVRLTALDKANPETSTLFVAHHSSHPQLET